MVCVTTVETKFGCLHHDTAVVETTSWSLRRSTAVVVNSGCLRHGSDGAVS